MGKSSKFRANIQAAARTRSQPDLGTTLSKMDATQLSCKMTENIQALIPAESSPGNLPEMAGIVKNCQYPHLAEANTTNESQRNSKRIKKSKLSNKCSSHLMNNEVNCDVKQCKKQTVSNNSLKKDSSSLKNYLVPLLHGWVREVVCRATSETSKCDIYYHPPEGKKLRSRLEVGRYLKSNGVKNLTAENFSFCASLLGLGEPYEISRNAAECPKFSGKRNLNDEKPHRSLRKRTVKTSSAENVKSSKLRLKYRCSDTSEEEHTFIESDELEVKNEVGEITGYEDWMASFSYFQTDGGFVKDLHDSDKAPAVVENIIIGMHKDQKISNQPDLGKTAVPTSNISIQNDHIHHSDHKAQKNDRLFESDLGEAELELEIVGVPNLYDNSCKYSDQKLSETYTKKDEAESLNFNSRLKFTSKENFKANNLTIEKNGEGKRNIATDMDLSVVPDVLGDKIECSHRKLNEAFTKKNVKTNDFRTKEENKRDKTDMSSGTKENERDIMDGSINIVCKMFQKTENLRNGKRKEINMQQNKLITDGPDSCMRSEYNANRKKGCITPGESNAEERVSVMKEIAHGIIVQPSGDTVSGCEEVLVGCTRPLGNFNSHMGDLIVEQTKDESLPVITQVQSGEEVSEKFAQSLEEPLQLWYVPPTTKSRKNREKNEVPVKQKCTEASLNSSRGLKPTHTAYSPAIYETAEMPVHHCNIMNLDVDTGHSLQHNNKFVSNNKIYTYNAIPQESVTRSKDKERYAWANTVENISQEDYLPPQPHEITPRTVPPKCQCSSTVRSHINFPGDHFHYRLPLQREPVTLQMKKGKPVLLRNAAELRSQMNTIPLQTPIMKRHVNFAQRQTATNNEKTQLMNASYNQRHRLNKQTQTPLLQNNMLPLQQNALLSRRLNSLPLQTSSTGDLLPACYATKPCRNHHVPQQMVMNSGQMNQNESQACGSSSQRSNFLVLQNSPSVGHINKPSLPQMITTNMKMNHAPQRISSLGMEQNNVLMQQVALSSGQINSSLHQTPVTARHTESCKNINLSSHQAQVSARRTNSLPKQIDTCSKQTGSVPHQGIVTPTGQINSVHQSDKWRGR